MRPRLPHRAALLAGLLAAASAAPAVHAQELPGSGLSASAEADDLFKKGKALFAEGKKEEAYQAYRKAWDLKKSYDIAGNLGNVELELGKTRDAAEHLAYCVETFPTTGSDEARARAVARLGEARKKVGALRIVVTVPDATVVVDGTPIGKAPLAPEVFVEPGEHTVEAKLAGYKDAKQVIQADAGSSQPVQLAMVAADPVTGPPVIPGNGGGSGPSTAVIGVGIGLGVAGVGAGIVFLILSGGKSSDREAAIAALPGTNVCGAGTSFTTECQEIEDLSASQRTFTGLGIGGLVVGGVALGGTLIYALASGGSKGEPAAQGGKIRVLPAMGPTGGSLTFTGSF